jgi:glutamate racemase
VVEIGCPDLVPIVESDALHTKEALEILTGYAKRISEIGADTLVLACTHYPLLLPVLGPLLPHGIKIVNPANLIPQYLTTLGTESIGELSFKVSGEPSTFEVSAAKILKRPVQAEQVTLSREYQQN